MTFARVDLDRGRHVSRRHALLLVALLVFQIAAPLANMLSPAISVFVLLPLYIVVLATAVLVMSSRRNRALIGVLSVPMVLAAIAGSFEPKHGSLLLSASTLPFLAYAASVVLRSVLSPGVIDQARLLGSASVFILMAQAWAGGYAGLELLQPGAFATPEGVTARPGDLSYFSFVTQTTLGYGDITPISPIARSAATLQAMVGLFYMGIIVARFTGRLQFSEASDAQDAEPRLETPRVDSAAANLRMIDEHRND